MTSLKEKLASNTVSVGSWITIGHPSVAEILLQSPFDWLVIDMEHSAITIEQAQTLIAAIQAAGKAPLVRVGENDAYLIKRVMDAGAHGVVVPMVNSKEDALRAVDSVKYPPEGKRGVGLYRAQAYGEGFDKYREWLSGNSVIIAQIEHIDAVNNIEEILSVKGIDGCIIGPYDLSASLGIPGNFQDKRLLDALEKVKTACKKRGKPLGYHIIQPDHKELKKKVDEGYTFLAFSLDFLFLGRKCKEELSYMKW
jgi:2-keto-3-deoxy-L-rhamnonate aldolase RhmA